MLKISSIECNANFSKFITIRWFVETSEEDLSEYTFNIHSSLSPDTGFSMLKEDAEPYEHLYDVSGVNNSSVHLYFKVETVHISGESEMSDVTGALYLTPRDYVAEAIIYQYNYFLEEILNRPPVKLLIKKRTGPRCTSCWDEELQQTTKSQCLTCYSTGYTGGFAKAKDIYISFTEPGFMTRFDIGDVKDVQQGNSQAWASNYPLILPSDIIIDESNRRFKVLQSQPTTKDGRIYLRQILQLQLLPPTDIVYKINVGD